MSRPDHSEMVKNDLEKFQNLSTGDMRDPAALLELVLAALAGLTLLAWFGSMFFLVPETIPSKLWMGRACSGCSPSAAPRGWCSRCAAVGPRSCGRSCGTL